MDTEKESELQRQFPIFLKDMHGDMMKTCMAWGCECGNGWYKPIEELCRAVEEINNKRKDGKVIAAQIKAKFGDLRVYWDWEGKGEVPEEVLKKMREIIQTADAKCGSTCEVCGHYEEGAEYWKHYNLCDECWKKAEWRKEPKKPD